MPKATQPDKTARARDAWAEIQSLRQQVASLRSKGFGPKAAELENTLAAKREAYIRTYGGETPQASAAPTRQYPPDVVTDRDRAEYDALLKANADGGR